GWPSATIAGPGVEALPGAARPVPVPARPGMHFCTCWRGQTAFAPPVVGSMWTPQGSGPIPRGAPPARPEHDPLPRPTIRDVAREAGVGLGTVSRVLGGSPRVAEQTRRRVREVIARLGYRPSPSARALSRGRSQTIEVILPLL